MAEESGSDAAPAEPVADAGGDEEAASGEPMGAAVTVSFVGERPPVPLAVDSQVVLAPADVKATASSTASPIRSKGIRYDAGRAVDGKTDTWWQESVAGDGLGQTLRLDWGRPAGVGVLRLVPGYMKRRGDRWGDRWPVNNRLRKIVVRLSSGETWPLELEDRRGWHDVRFAPPPTASWVEVEVLSVYPGAHPKTGARVEDTGVSEAQVWLVK